MRLQDLLQRGRARPRAAGPTGPVRLLRWPAGLVQWLAAVLITLLVDGQPHRPLEWVPLQRIRCARCIRSWTLRPPWLYPHRSLEPDLAEAAALAYLLDPLSRVVQPEPLRVAHMEPVKGRERIPSIWGSVSPVRRRFGHGAPKREAVEGSRIDAEG